MATTPAPQTYPASFAVEYPDRLDRLTTFFRIFTAIPILVILGLLSSGTVGWHGSGSHSYEYAGTGLIFLPLVLMILFRQKYPRWWFDWNLNVSRFFARVFVYMALLRDEYPSTDEEQAVRLDYTYPDAKNDLNRWLPLVKWFLAIPHYIVLFFLNIAAVIAVFIAWFAILFTGRYPRSLFDLVVGVYRWDLRVGAYAALLVTDRYPPFSLSE